jgi:hypothetical protein
LPSNYPGITFDSEGICNYCRQTKKAELLGEDRFHEIIDTYRNGPGKYDCMVALSGGRDSSYVLWLAVRKLGLRTLAVFVDNGCVPEQTRANVETATKTLGVDLVVKKHDLVTKCTKHTMKSWMKRPTPGMIGLLCAGCTLGLRIKLLEAAKENDIPMMLYGVGEPEQSFAEKYMSYNPHGAITKRALAIGFLSELGFNPSYLASPRGLGAYTKEFLFRFSPAYRRRVLRNVQPSGFTQVEPFYYMKWDEQEILSVIRRDLNWGSCAYTKNTWRTDCTIAILKNYLYQETVGFSKVEELLSNLIRLGMITREEAVERLKRDSVISDEFVNEFFETLGLDVADLRKALTRAKKSKYYLNAG